MGLEIVEVIMDIEESFGVRFDWDGHLRTVADLQVAVVKGLECAARQSGAEARARYQDLGLG